MTADADPTARAPEPVAEEAGASGPRPVHGCYEGEGAGFRLELRIDVDGPRPQRRISGDFFATSGTAPSCFGSFVLTDPWIEIRDERVTIEGDGAFTFKPRASRVRVTVPRRSATEPPGEATVCFFSASGAGASYRCAFVSPYFRSVVLEQDSVVGAVPFVSYDTAALPRPDGSAARNLSVVDAFAEAGIEIRMSGTANVIPTDGAGADLTWDDAELHNAMERHFSTLADGAPWQVWLLVASRHVRGLRGIMFDSHDARQRQGAAVFYDAIKGDGPAALRAQLRTYVHELGHAFNLLHSWQKNLARPPQPLGPNGGLGDLSWMNYVQHYRPPSGPGGEAAYWAAFPFQFTDSELVHLRHGFYRDVVMGGNAFATGAADTRAAEIAPEMFDEPGDDDSGLTLEVRAKEEFALGEPVVVELKLSPADPGTGPGAGSGAVRQGRPTHGHLHPGSGFTHIAITLPGGRTVLYEPMLRHCTDDGTTVRLDAHDPAAYRSAYIGHGAAGHYFQRPGEYHVRAQHITADGSRVVSPACVVSIRPPLSRDDERVAELMLGEEQGKLLTLLGSDAPSLRSGNEALDEVIDQYADHPVAVYARMVKGINAEREFKDLVPDAGLRIRPPDAAESIAQLTAVVDASKQDRGVDNITLNMVMRRLAAAEAIQGNLAEAHAVLDRMVETFAAKGVNPIVLDRIRQQAEQTGRALDAEVSGGAGEEVSGEVSGEA